MGVCCLISAAVGGWWKVAPLLLPGLRALHAAAVDGALGTVCQQQALRRSVTPDSASSHRWRNRRAYYIHARFKTPYTPIS